MTRASGTERLGRPAARLLALVPYLLARPGVRVAEAAARLRRDRARSCARTCELLWMCGLPGHGPGDLIDLSFEGDTRHRHLRRRHVPAAAADRRRGARAGRRAAHAGREAGPDRPRRGRAGAGQGGGRGRRRRRGGQRGRGAGGAARTGCSRSVRAALDAGPGAAPDLLRAGPGRDAPSGTSTRCGCAGWTAAGIWRPGAARAEDVRLFRLDRVDAVEVLDEPSRPPADLAPARDLSRRGLPAGAGPPAGHAPARPARAAGSPTTTRASRSPSCPAAGWRSRCGRPTRLGAPAGASGWARRPRWSGRGWFAEQVRGRGARTALAAYAADPGRVRGVLVLVFLGVGLLLGLVAARVLGLVVLARPRRRPGSGGPRRRLRRRPTGPRAAAAVLRAAPGRCGARPPPAGGRPPTERRERPAPAGVDPGGRHGPRRRVAR